MRSHWVLIEAERPDQFEHVVIGPFATAVAAIHHLQDSLQVQGMCDDDAIDAWVVDSSAAKDVAAAAWTAAGENWGLYRPVRDDEVGHVRCVSPAAVGLLPTVLTTTPAPAHGRTR